MMKNKKVQIILIPYDSGNRGLRMGAGPEHFTGHNLQGVLETAGCEVAIETIESGSEFRAEAQTQFELYRTLAGQIEQAHQNGAFPLILSGNCGASLGAIAGLQMKPSGLIWFDAHGDFNTPETTEGGFLDGMALAIAAGLCWRKLALSIPNFQPVEGSHLLHLGGRDFDVKERTLLKQSGVMVIDAEAFVDKKIENVLLSALENLKVEVGAVHLHIDLDVLNPKEAPANGYAVGETGLSVNQVIKSIKLIKRNLEISSATVAAFDPKYDVEGKMLQAGFEIIKAILE